MKFNCYICKKLTDWNNGYMKQRKWGTMLSKDIEVDMVYICLDCHKERIVK